VRDRSRIHNAHVVAPGFDRKATFPFLGTQTWTIALKRTGTFRFLCDPHAVLGMRGSAKIVR
jgi:plastocyanin